MMPLPKCFGAIVAKCTTLNDANTTDNETINVLEEVQTFNARIANLPLTFDFNSECDDEFNLNSMLVTWPYLTGELYALRQGDTVVEPQLNLSPVAGMYL
jgi:hypothetical protein